VPGKENYSLKAENQKPSSSNLLTAGRAFRFAEGSWEEPCPENRGPAGSQKETRSDNRVLFLSINSV
jgi:hypothetical protein